MSALVFASHLPGEGHFHSDRFEVTGWECAGDLGYWEGLAAVWESDRTIINLEHDIEVTDDHVETLVACPHPACAWAYECHWASTGIPGGVIAAGAGARDAERNPDPGYLQGGEEWAAWSAIGLVKLTREARTGPLRCEPWQRLELAVHDAIKRPWHMHWTPPLEHHHW